MKIVKENISHFEKPKSKEDFKNRFFPRPFIVTTNYNLDVNSNKEYLLSGTDLNYIYATMLGSTMEFMFYYNYKEDYFYTIEDKWHFNKPNNWGMELIKEYKISYEIKKIKPLNKTFNYIIINGDYFEWKIKKPYTRIK